MARDRHRCSGLESPVPDIQAKLDRSNRNCSLDSLRWCREPAGSVGLAGFNIAIEIRELCEFYDAMVAEGDIDKRIELRNENVEFLAHWMPVIGTVARPNVALANPNKLASWDMPLSVREAALHHPEFIVLK